MNIPLYDILGAEPYSARMEPDRHWGYTHPWACPVYAMRLKTIPACVAEHVSQRIAIADQDWWWTSHKDARGKYVEVRIRWSTAVRLSSA